MIDFEDEKTRTLAYRISTMCDGQSAKNVIEACTAVLVSAAVEEPQDNRNVVADMLDRCAKALRVGASAILKPESARGRRTH